MSEKCKKENLEVESWKRLVAN